jgi:hypothetical protein
MFLDFLNSNRTLYDSVFACLSPGTLARYSRTCRGSRDAVLAFNRRAYNINRHLSRFFDNPHEFRAMQACTGTLISGSNALQFLDRTLYEDADLDLYVDDLYREEVGRYLERIGYRFEPRQGQTAPFGGSTYHKNGLTGFTPPAAEVEIYYGMRGVAVVFNFIKKGPPMLKIQLITATNSPLEIIINFHSSE